MSYFDSRVYGCPVWRVVLIRVMESRRKTDMTVLVAGA
nr:MAG TPA: hypothetical protein [Caudoviricetes sp.]